MNLVLFSSDNSLHSEIPSVIKMFDNGLETFHLRKPKFGTKELEQYIQAIPRKYRDKIIIHSHHELASIYGLKGIHYSRTHRKKGKNGKSRFGITRLLNRKLVFTKSCHSIGTINDDIHKYNYTFLSPVFDSISKNEYKSKLSLTKVKISLQETKQTVYALGGITPDNVELAMKTGFKGVGVLGYIWDSEHDPVEAYLTIKSTIRKLEEALILQP